MLKLLKSNDNEYAWTFKDSTIISGTRSEIIAYGYWNYGFDKDQIDKIVKSLTKENNSFEFIQNKNIS